LADGDDIEDVMLPYGELRLDAPVLPYEFVQLNDETRTAERTRQDAASAKFHAVFAKGQAKLVTDDHRLTRESPRLAKPY